MADTKRMKRQQSTVVRFCTILLIIISLARKTVMQTEHREWSERVKALPGSSKNHSQILQIATCNKTQKQYQVSFSWAHGRLETSVNYYY